MNHQLNIAPSILRLHPNLHPQQQQFIAHQDGPLLTVAGPGSGKTRCIELRALNLLLHGSATPDELLLTTFSKTAAQELQQRLRVSASSVGYTKDISMARITTIHSLCHRIVRPYARTLGLKRDYRILGPNDQTTLIRQEFDYIFRPDLDVFAEHGWADDAHVISNSMPYFDRIAEERIAIGKIMNARSAFDAALARCCERYLRMLRRYDCVDFGQLLTLADELLDDDRIANDLGRRIVYMMVDEAQDTSHIQDRILRRLAEANGNIALVGDDDQAIYGFRGANVENMLAFPQRYPDAKVLHLCTNYRSHPAIIRAYVRWMASADWHDPEGNVRLRYDKEIVADESAEHPAYPAVIVVQGSSAYDEGRRLGELIRFLKSRDVIADYAQCAVLLHSVKPTISDPYIDGFQDAMVPIRCVPGGRTVGSNSRPVTDEITVTTIHSSKGLEWDVVAVGSLDFHGGNPDPVGRRLAKYLPRGASLQHGSNAEHARMRQHYVGFSRPRRLLILTASGQPHPRFDTLWREAPRWPDVDLDSLSRQRFGERNINTTSPEFNISSMKRLVVRMGSPRSLSAGKPTARSVGWSNLG